MNSIAYQQYCLTRPVGVSVIAGGLFSAIDMAQGSRLSPRLVGTNIGGLYLYNILTCPMEAIHGRPSSLHNFMSGAILGYVGVSRRVLGVPFVDPYFFMRHPQLSPPTVGAAVYGAMGFLFAAMLGGKPV